MISGTLPGLGMSSGGESKRRVVITGVGMVTPIGTTKEAFWNALATRTSGVRPLAAIPPDFLPTSFAGEVIDFTGAIDDFGELEGEQKKAIRKAIKLMSRECQMGVAAALKAFGDARLAAGSFDPERAGIVFGADYMLSPPQEFNAGIDLCAGAEREFNFSRWGNEGMSKMNPLWLLKYLPNMPSCHVAIYMDLRGPNNSITQREAAANFAVGEAYRTILRGSADIMVAGATGTRVHLMKTLHALQQEEIAGNGAEPHKACRPFDRERTGMVLGEGSGAIILEERSRAEARGATIYGEVLGAASSVVVDRDLVARRDLAISNALKKTLLEAGLSPGDVGHLHAHGLSTRSCDREEATAVRIVFGERANRLPVTAAKSYFGNLGAGSGVVELIASLLAMQNDSLPPVLNHDTPDPECSLHIADGSQPPGQSVMNVSVTPQGQASCVLVGR
jgi:3-oxoacyl-[acyl-carrier-protein] synthase II